MTLVLSPQNENELADIVCAAGMEKRALEIAGHGTKRGLGRAVEISAVLDLSALSGIVRYEPDELVITARAATSMREIAEALSVRNQHLGFDPADWGALYGCAGDATIGGVLSADASGSARIRYGAARDHLLGFRAANGLGEIYKAGGRVVKNVTGFDLPKLICGAMGTLGALTEVTLRVVPRPPQSFTMLVRNIGAESGLAFLRRVWSGPLEPSGLAFIPREAARAFPELSEIGDGMALLRVDGAPQALGDKIIEAAKALLVACDCVLLPDAGAPFSRIASGAAFAGRSGDIWRVFVPPAAAPACARELASPFWLADWAGGVLWLEDAQSSDIHAIAARAGGHAILMRTENRHRTDIFPPEPPVRAALTRRVKAAFDPLGLFNPGRMFEGV